MTIRNEWKTIKAPRMLYLPVAAAEFDNSGLRVEPTDDLAILPGTNRVRVNGVEHLLMRPLDDLLDENGVIQLAKPAPPVRLHAGGPGRASVAAIGGARLRKGDFDLSEAENWQGDVGTDRVPFQFDPQPPNKAGATHARGFPIVREETPAFGKPVRVATTRKTGNPDVDQFFDEFNAHMNKGTEPSEYREVTLRDGSKARALFSTVTGRQIGTPTRQYQATYDSAGVQQGQQVGYSGKNPTFNEKEYRQRLDEQLKDSTVAPTGHDIDRGPQAPIHDLALNAPVGSPHARVPRRGMPAAPTMPATSTGNPHLDALIGGKDKTCQGWPLGKISHLYGDTPLVDALIGNATHAASIDDAVERIHLLREDDPPLIAIACTTTPDLGPLAKLLREHHIKVAVVLHSKEGGGEDLMQLPVALRLRAEPHDRDERFITATLVRALAAKDDNSSASFPRP